MGAAGAAAVMILLRILSRHDKPETILVYGSLGVSVVMVAPGIYFWQPLTAIEWLMLALVAVVSYYGQKLNIYAYKHGEASLLASLDYVRLLWATFFGFLVFDHLPGASTWIGAAIVVAAAIFMIYREAVRKQQISAPAAQGETERI
ncbi:MAG: DMT family transporter [Pseudomonadota bacterium]